MFFPTRTTLWMLIPLLTLSLKLHANSSEHQREQVIEIQAPSLQNSVISTKLQQPIYVHLPLSYFSTQQDYPVVYYLHGYNGSINEAKYLSSYVSDEMVKENQANEMIVVGVNGNNYFGGSFWANSPVTGNWEDFLLKDVISYVDTHYRTLSDAKYRGLAGFSMGGGAATNIALKHPNTFKHLFVLSGGLFDENGLDNATKQWKSNSWHHFLDGYAATFSPNLESTNHRKWLDWDETSNEIRELWKNGFGNLDIKVANYAQGKDRLLSVRIEYGTHDKFKWIPQGSHYLANQLRSTGLQVEEVTHDGGHSLTIKQGKHMVSFFTESFR